MMDATTPPGRPLAAPASAMMSVAADRTAKGITGHLPKGAAVRAVAGIHRAASAHSTMA